jgi:leucyl aminopeptidase
MISGRKSTSLDVFSDDLHALDTDLVVVPVFDAQAPQNRWLLATGGELERALGSKEFCAKLYEVFFARISDGGYRATRLVAVGLGSPADFTVDRARRAATTAALAARQKHIGRIAFLLEDRLETVDVIQAVAEGLTLAEFDAGRYKTVGDEPTPITSLTLITQTAHKGASAAAGRGRLLGECTNIARELANEPSNRLTPSVFADRAASISREGGLAVEVLDRNELARLGMGMLLGVGQGSHEPPTMIVIRHEPAGAPLKPVLGLVGKGITFDTGGISIKPADGMDRMKDDMAGGAAVVGAMRAIAALKAPINVLGVIPIAENMPGGRAFRPGDVLTSASGKTVEVLNTDAEGRLILGDALWHAQQIGATHLVDIATLTGAIGVALGKFTSGLFGTPPAWAEHVRAVAERAGDRCWLMPLYEEYRDLLKSDIADMVNIGGRYGGAITAALFLKEFTGGLPWAHMDIAGTAWVEDARPYIPKGAAGIGVRTLAELAFTSDSWPVK